MNSAWDNTLALSRPPQDPDEFSGGDSEFEESMGDLDAKKVANVCRTSYWLDVALTEWCDCCPWVQNSTFVNKPYDEAFDLSGESSAAETPSQQKAMKLANDMYDEAFEVSQSLDTRDGLGISVGSPNSVRRGFVCWHRG